LSSADVSVSATELPADLLLSKPTTRDRVLEAVNTLYRMNELSALGRKVRAREHRLRFVREEHGPAVETAPAYERADATLDDLQEEWQNELEDRDAWRSLEEAESIDELLADASGTADE
jgi:hypothetical protein